MSSLKEQIVREMIDLLQRAPEGRQIDLGSLVMFLDEESLGWIYGQTLHTYPLYEYVQAYTGWTEDQFLNVLAPLEARLSGHYLQMEFSDPPLSDYGDEGHTMIQKSPFGGAGAMAAALIGGSGPAQDDSFSDEIREALIDLIIRCTSQTEVEDIIDPSKLRGFLAETIDEMKEGDICNLQMLWEILLDAPGVSQDMLIPAFLLMEREESPVPLVLPSLVQKLPEKIRSTMLAKVGVTLAVDEEPAPSVPPEPAANQYMMQRSSPPEKPAPGPSAATGERPVPPQRPPSQSKRAERPQPKPKPKPKAKGKGKGRGVQGPRARIDGGGGIPGWLIGLLVVILVAGGVLFFLSTRKPSGTTLEGRIVDVMKYRSIFPAQEVRINKRKLLVRVRSVFLGFDGNKRVKVAQKLWIKMRQDNPRINSMILFKPDGTVLQTFSSR